MDECIDICLLGLLHCFGQLDGIGGITFNTITIECIRPVIRNKEKKYEKNNNKSVVYNFVSSVNTNWKYGSNVMLA